MQKFLRVILASFLLVTSVMSSRAARLGEVVAIVDKDKLLVRVSSSSPELQTLALTAFSAHGRYKLVASNYAYDIKFTAVPPAQVRVDVTKGAAGTPVASELVAGANLRNALLRAADVAVVKTNGLGLKGFFTARLAFILEHGRAQEVGISDLFFTEAKQITTDNSHALMPRWAPDGARIIYTSYFKSGSPDVFLLDVNTRKRDVFASFRGTNQGARFSPNGQQVAMVLSGTGTPQIYVTNGQGSRPVARTQSNTAKSSPCFSPDGSQIVFAMEPGPQLWVMSAAGSNPQRLVTGFTYSAEPDWNRVNPNKIACTVKVGSRYQIAVFDRSKGSAEVVSEADFDGIEPSWLPDGRHLVYTARDRTTSVLCVLDTETHQSKRISASNLGPTMQASIWAP